MSFAPGQLTSTDLSPNAGILGTQIQDGTIQLRNIAPDAIINSYIVDTTITGDKIDTLLISGKEILADTGTIGGWTLASDHIYDNGANVSIQGTQTAYNTGVGFWLGLVGGTAKLSLGDPAGDSLTWDGSALNITGALTASTGTIGGFTIGADYIEDLADSFGLASTITGGDDVRFWAGSTFADRATAPFNVSETGVVSASNIGITGGSIAGWTINSQELVGPSGSAIRSGQTGYNQGTGFYIGNPAGTTLLSIGNSAGNQLTWDGTNLHLTGGITAATGAIGGFNIGSDYVRDSANSMGMASTVSSGDDVRFWAGATFANRATAPFNVTESGAATMSNVNITGGSITGTGMVSVAALNLANRGWTQTSTFAVSGASTVTWTSGTFVTADGGTTLSIASGTTGVMAAKTYIYLDASVSLTTYQTTTTATTAVGASKVLVAIAQNGTGEATFQVLSGQGGQNIDGSNIVANSITANELSASILYAGSLQIDTSGNIRSGQTAFNTGIGWFIGNSSGTAKFSIGDPTNNNMTWDGSYLKVHGNVTLSSALNNFSDTVANLPIPPSTIGYNNPAGNA